MEYFAEKYGDKMGVDMPFDLMKMAYGGFDVVVSS
jgi:uncharacterized protein YbaA (DUF1428 family)